MNTLQKFVVRFLKTNRGFTLVEVMISALVMGGLGLVMMEITKQQSTQGVDYQITADVAQMKTEIQTYLTSPAHCNANFWGKGPGASVPAPTAVFRCTSTVSLDCHVPPGTGASVSQIPKATGSTWTGTGSISNRVRISNLVATVTPLAIPSGVTKVLTIATLAVTFDKKYLKGIKQETFTYSTPVVWDGGTVQGCPRTWNSTTPY